MNERSHTSYILHADGDSFFVACEVARRPELRGLPVVVGEDRGIAAAMSYEAKRLGIHRGMPVYQIKKLYPECVILNHHFEYYREVSDGMYQILLSYVESVERYSIDECFAVVKHSDLVYFGGAENMLAQIKEEIERTYGVTYSFGLARTKGLAKVASKLEKPNGLVVLATQRDEDRALRATSIDNIWGAGRKAIPRLQNLGLATAYDLAHFDRERIARYFSEPMVVLQRELCGERVLHVEDDQDPRAQKSIQSTGTFRPKSSDPKVIWAQLAENIEYACKRARSLRLLGNKVSFFAKTADFRYHIAEQALVAYTADPGSIMNAIEHAFLRMLIPGEVVRATGITLHGLIKEESAPVDLFGAHNRSTERSRIEIVADGLRAKYGADIVRRASSLPVVARGDADSFHPRVKAQ